MPPTIKILLPSLQNNLKEVMLKGFIKRDENTITVFITTFSNQNILEGCLNNPNIIYGCNIGNRSRNKLRRYQSNFTVNLDTDPITVTSLVIDCQIQNLKENCIVMLYEYQKMKKSETISSSDVCFSTLQNLIHKDSESTNDELLPEVQFQSSSFLGSCMFAQHVYNYFNLLKWLLHTVKKKEKITIKQRNLMLAIVGDIILGYLTVELLMFDKKYLGTLILGMLEKLVNLMYSLLKWLMGAPAGLKLNNAFNKMLGKFFLYHVELWWLFLDVSSDKLDIILSVCQYLGYLGFTFQAAIISDMICMATFHSYCIYIYAARLFNIQISGLIALLRLFVGRKYNPLRGGIDSCEYTNQQLFVGTVAFTILLLLLPTTLMYYIVFTANIIIVLAIFIIKNHICYTNNAILCTCTMDNKVS
ncbi:phosphatidylinositol N-acetylglucosaminyltransferase subunit Q isoform X2 [Danaus plexippus]|uniref:phosphatidylinositol N-acetylglucosaminyltransferase subunit Q isoform X2 n=1 Tax=Danaus plexippus TaxID=13037 RepID=UPI002AB07A23|nr:phosphatidylinositol N-acetylglucosaminyltransferase subunit Q isoform X2 [Danaus plexippus]